MDELLAKAPQTPEGLLEAYIYAQEAGSNPRVDEYTDRLGEESERLRLREMISEMGRIQRLFPVPVRAETRLGGRYRLIRELGVGGFGKVWLAADERLDDKPVAVKVLGGLAARDVEADLERERKALARATHPGIVGILDAGRHEDHPFLVMRVVPGLTLATLIARLVARGGGPPAADAVRAAAGLEPGSELYAAADDWWRFCAVVVARALDAVVAAHDASVFHRDLKPSNIMLEPGGAVVLLDFGVARIADPGAQVSASGFTGTVAYMAPEQVGGAEPAGPERIDLYQVGRVLYELLTLRPAVPHDLPFGELLERARAGRFATPRQVAPQVPADFEAVCLHALEVDPRRRYRDAAEFHADAVELSRRLPPVHAPTTPWAGLSRRARRLWRQHRRAAWTSSGLVVGLVAGVAMLLLLATESAAFRVLRDGSRIVVETDLVHDGRVLAYVQVMMSPTKRIERWRVPLRVVEVVPFGDGRERVELALPARTATAVADLPDDRLAVQLVELLELEPAERDGVERFHQRLTDWVETHDEPYGVPYEKLVELAEMDSRGGGVAPAVLLGEAWPRAVIGAGR